MPFLLTLHRTLGLRLGVPLRGVALFGLVPEPDIESEVYFPGHHIFLLRLGA